MIIVNLALSFASSILILIGDEFEVPFDSLSWIILLYGVSFFLFTLLFFIAYLGLFFVVLILFTSLFPSKSLYKELGSNTVKYTSMVTFLVVIAYFSYQLYLNRVDSTNEVAADPSTVSIIISVVSMTLPFVYLFIMLRSNNAKQEDILRYNNMPFLSVSIDKKMGAFKKMFTLSKFDVIRSKTDSSYVRYIKVSNRTNRIIKDLSFDYSFCTLDNENNMNKFEVDIYDELFWLVEDSSIFSLLRGEEICFELKLPMEGILQESEHQTFIERNFRSLEIYIDVRLKDVLNNTYTQTYSIFLKYVKSDDDLIYKLNIDLNEISAMKLV